MTTSSTATASSTPLETLAAQAVTAASTANTNAAAAVTALNQALTALQAAVSTADTANANAAAAVAAMNQALSALQASASTANADVAAANSAVASANAEVAAVAAEAASTPSSTTGTSSGSTAGSSSTSTGSTTGSSGSGTTSSGSSGSTGSTTGSSSTTPPATATATTSAQVATLLAGTTSSFLDTSIVSSMFQGTTALSIPKNYETGLTEIKDQSGGGNNMMFVAAPTNGNLPSYGGNGLPGLSFGESVGTTQIGGSTTAFLVMIGLIMPSGGWEPTFYSDAGAANTGYQLTYNESAESVVFTAGLGTSSQSVSVPFLKNTGPSVFTAWHDGSTINLQINSSPAVSAPCGTVTAGTAQTSLAAANVAAQTNVDWSEYFEILIVKNNCLNAADRAAIQGYFEAAIGAPAAAPAIPTTTLVTTTAAPLPADTGITKSFSSTSSNTSPADLSEIYGGYNISANIWSPPATYTQTMSGTVQSAGGVPKLEIDWDFPGSDGSVKTYPNIQFGQQSNTFTTTDSRMPALLSGISTLTTVGSSLTTLTGTSTQFNTMYDAGFDIFFTAGTPAAPNGQPGGELMILQQWINNGLGGNVTPNFTYTHPDGTTTEYFVRVLTIPGVKSWPYVAFWAINQTTNLNLDLMQFINYAFSKGYYNGSVSGVAAASPAMPYPFTATGPYIDMVEVGLEVEYGSGTTVIQDFAVSLTMK